MLIIWMNNVKIVFKNSHFIRLIIINFKFLKTILCHL